MPTLFPFLHRFAAASTDPSALPTMGLRHADQQEVEAAGFSMQDALVRSRQVSTFCLSAMDESGEPVAVFGVAPHPDDPSVGIPWFLATAKMNPRDLLKHTPAWLEQMHQHFPVLTNYVHAGNEQAIRYLKWAGFTVSPDTVPLGPKGAPFHVFTRTAHDATG